MRVAALFSGGKDSTYAAYLAMQRGWEVSPLITIRPADPESMMFHVPNLHLTTLQAEAMGLPLLEEVAEPGEEGELEALRRAFRRSGADGIVVGAIASDYQHSRVNRVAHELALPTFAPLWRQDPARLVREYLDAGLKIAFSSVSADGFSREWLGRSWDEAAVKDLLRLRDAHGVHPCGEGGEFETLVTDAPCFHRRLVVDRATPEWHGSWGAWRVEEAHLEAKTPWSRRSGAGQI